MTWNQKNLDYEIETCSLGLCSHACSKLETKRTSITRLKRGEVRWGIGFACAWNQKNLDYEIETEFEQTFIRRLRANLKPKEPRLRDWNFGLHNSTIMDWFLETKRTSITRLKQ